MTDEQHKLARKYVLYKVLTNLWFVGAVWLYFYRIFITDQQIGILDGLAFAIGLLAEVPSGALADKFGRDKLVRIGYLIAGGGLVLQGFSSSFPFFLLGQTLMMIGISFVSGADDALFYENLNFETTSSSWRKLVTRGSQMGLAGAVLARVIGGALYDVDPRLPWVLNGLALISAALLVWSITDSRMKKARQKFVPELKEYLLDIKTGFAQFMLPKLRLYIPLIITIQGLFYTTGYGLLRLVLLDRFGFSPFVGSIAIASCSLITIGLLAYMHKYADKFSEKRILTVIGLAAAASLLLSVANIGYWGYFVILALYAGEYILHPIMSEILNKQAPGEQRATVLSVASFFKTLPYVFLAPIIGYLNTEGRLEYFLIVWAILICLSIAIYLLIKKRDVQIVLEKLS